MPKRTKRNRWTDEEVAILRDGMARHAGKWNMWALIVEEGNLVHRTAVDLKDKARNLKIAENSVVQERRKLAKERQEQRQERRKLAKKARQQRGIDEAKASHEFMEEQKQNNEAAKLDAFARYAAATANYHSQDAAACVQDVLDNMLMALEYHENVAEELTLLGCYHQVSKPVDPEKELARLVSSRMNSTMGFSNMDYIGCSMKELMTHLEGLFLPGMSWKNRGQRLTHAEGWEIDHICALALFDLSVVEERKVAFHFSNMQPMWALANRAKGVTGVDLSLSRTFHRPPQS